MVLIITENGYNLILSPIAYFVHTHFSNGSHDEVTECKNNGKGMMS